MFKSKIDYKITLTIFISLFWLALSAENWEVPADKKARNSYIQFTPATAKQGEDIFTKNCVSCHGNPGKGNSLKSLNPVPPDLGGSDVKVRTDGELFYMISTGKQIMPSFANVLSEEERWKVISYIRTFDKNYVQVLSKFDPTKSKLVKVTLTVDSVAHKIVVNAIANEKSGIVPLHDDEISMFVERYFGRLPIGKAVKSDAQGNAVFDFPTDIPGNKAGELNVIVKLADDTYGEIESQSKLKLGVPTDKPPLTENRAIWNVMAKAPIWLLLTYTFSVLIVISCFLYIFYNLFKIKKSGNN